MQEATDSEWSSFLLNYTTVANIASAVEDRANFGPGSAEAVANVVVANAVKYHAICIVNSPRSSIAFNTWQRHNVSTT